MIDAGRWELPSVFAMLQQGGGIEPGELARTFNCGIGMAVIVAADSVAEASRLLEGAGETVIEIGRVEAGPRGCTVSGESGWGATQPWSATHNG
jgi:phosphoribosylformylglycinamidine cyclo-ligase